MRRMTRQTPLERGHARHPAQRRGLQQEDVVGKKVRAPRRRTRRGPWWKMARARTSRRRSSRARSCRSGEFAEVTIKDWRGYDLVAGWEIQEFKDSEFG